jgi:hypothetical protein
VDGGWVGGAEGGVGTASLRGLVGRGRVGALRAQGEL